MKSVERFAFYERAKKAFAVVATGWAFIYLLLFISDNNNNNRWFLNLTVRETALYGNLIIKKGVIPPDEQCWKKSSLSVLKLVDQRSYRYCTYIKNDCI